LRKESIVNTTTTQRNRKPLPEVHGTCKWIHRPSNGLGEDPNSGLIEINGTLYALLIHETAYEIFKEDKTTYHLPRDLSSCDCPDGTYRCERPGGCKHRKALAALLRAAGL
jgi:hypothetical protein